MMQDQVHMFTFTADEFVLPITLAGGLEEIHRVKGVFPEEKAYIWLRLQCGARAESKQPSVRLP